MGQKSLFIAQNSNSINIFFICGSQAFELDVVCFMKPIILHIIPTLGKAGAETALVRLVSGSIARFPGFGHVVVVLTVPGFWSSELQSKNVSVFYLGLNGCSSIFSALFKSIKIVKNIKPSIIHGWMYHSCLLSFILHFFFRSSRIVWGIRNSVPVGSPSLTWLIRSVMAVLSRLDLVNILYVSKESMSSHMTAGFSEKKGSIIPNFVNFNPGGVSLFHANSHLNLNSPIRSIVILSVARYHKVKGHKIFLKSLSRLRSADVNFVALMAGHGVDDDNLDLLSLREELGLKDCVSFLGHKSKMGDLFYASDIYCLHSLSEGFPNSLLEASSYGLTCVATKVGGVDEVVSNSSLLATPGSDVDLFHALKYACYLSDSERQNIGNANRKLVFDRFGENRILGLYNDFYEKL